MSRETAIPVVRILPPTGLVLSIAAQLPLIVVFYPMQPSWSETVGGLSLILIGIGLNVASDRVFRRQGIGVRPFSPTPSLAVSGPFRFSRNPMYLGLVAIGSGVAVSTGILPNLIWAFLLAIWLQAAYIGPEERFLRERLGSSFDDYSSRVPRWLLW